jgi:DNA-binding NarL/FixJ family response regulator
VRHRENAIEDAPSLDDLGSAVAEYAFQELGVSSLHFRLFSCNGTAQSWWKACHTRHSVASINQMMDAMLPLAEQELGGMARLFGNTDNTFDLNKRLGNRLTRSKTYNEFWRPYNIEKQLFATLCDAGKPLGFIAVARTRGEGELVDTNVTSMRHLRDSILSALRRLRAGQGYSTLDLMSALQSLPIRSALFDLAGTLIWISREASQALDLRRIAVHDTALVLPGEALRRWQDAAVQFGASGHQSAQVNGLHLRRAQLSTSTIILVVENEQLDRSKGASDTAAARWRLTPRERDVLSEICRGHSNKEIAQSLGCAVRTVDIHVSSILRKSGTRSRAEVMAQMCWPGSSRHAPLG